MDSSVQEIAARAGEDTRRDMAVMTAKSVQEPSPSFRNVVSLTSALLSDVPSKFPEPWQVIHNSLKKHGFFKSYENSNIV